MNIVTAAVEPIGVEDLKNLIGELRMMAKALLDTESGLHSFTPTALAITALLRAKLEEQEWEEVRWENRAHFFDALKTAMRNALVDHSRRRKAKGRDRIDYFTLDEDFFQDLPVAAEQRPERILILEEALAQLEAGDKRLADAVYQYYYLGYSVPQMARFVSMSEKTVHRDLRKARIVLRKLVENLARA